MESAPHGHSMPLLGGGVQVVLECSSFPHGNRHAQMPNTHMQQHHVHEIQHYVDLYEHHNEGPVQYFFCIITNIS